MGGAGGLWILLFLAAVAVLHRLRRFAAENVHFFHRYKIPRLDEDEQENPLHRRARAYLSALPSLEDSDLANIFSSETRSKIRLEIEPGRSVRDAFLGAPVLWTRTADGLILRLRRRDRRRVLRPYIHHVESVAEELFRKRDLRLFTVSGSGWRSAPFSHPATLDSVAADPDVKVRVRSDLESFLKNKPLYARLGRVWKRAYLLHGPPGSGKSAFAAAMANHLRYDLYELDLSLPAGLAQAKDLIRRTAPRSVILIEGLDRCRGLADALLGSCGEERVVVLTAAEESTADPAVDVRVPFPPCSFPTFKAMAEGCLGIKDHKLFPQVEEWFQGGSRISHSEIAEIMISNRGSTSRALKAIMAAIRDRTAQVCPVPDSEDPPEVGIRKLYGLIKLRGGSRRFSSATSPPDAAVDRDIP